MFLGQKLKKKNDRVRRKFQRIRLPRTKMAEKTAPGTIRGGGVKRRTGAAK